jgi:large subunit ribosomal protein L30
MCSMLNIKLIKSSICTPAKHRSIIAGLGLKKLNQTVVRKDSPQIRGMISKISHMLTVD